MPAKEPSRPLALPLLRGPGSGVCPRDAALQHRGNVKQPVEDLMYLCVYMSGQGQNSHWRAHRAGRHGAPEVAVDLIHEVLELCIKGIVIRPRLALSPLLLDRGHAHIPGPRCVGRIRMR